METKEFEEVVSPQLNIGSIGKCKHWYRVDVHGCILCGKEKVSRERVYNEDAKGKYWHEDACGNHFC
jgi:hypothetical protein